VNPTEHWHGRPLTETEQRFRADHRCIACAAKVEPIRLKRTGDGKWEWTWPMECRECLRTRTQTGDGREFGGRDLGRARASAAAQGPRLLGYGPRDGSGAEMRDDGDD